MPASRWLVAYAIGPVSDFIATARRMRDLWFGSFLLSELAKAALDAAKDLGAEAVFPLSTSPSAAASAQPAGALPNRAVLVWQGADPDADFVCRIRTAVQDKLTTIATKAKAQFVHQPGYQPGDLVCDLFDAQVGDLIEFYAAWVPWPGPAGADDGYQPAYRRLQQLLLACKRTRLFVQEEHDTPGRQKSALDAARPSVLSDKYLKPRQRRQRFFGIEGDPLDAPGLIKRVLGRERAFPAITRVAIDPWIEALHCTRRTEFDALDSAYSALCTHDLASPSSPHKRFCVDGQLLLEDRLELARTQAAGERDAMLALDALQLAHAAAIEALDKRPDPYVALLAVDIDEFGRRLWNSATRGEQEKLAHTAAAFATELVTLVESANGVVLYAGGDEALAILPLPQALACAEALAAALATAGQANDINPPLTLSAGVLMAHALTPLARLRQDALAALALAKEGLGPCDTKRNALAVVGSPRSGGEITVRGRWPAGQTEPWHALGARLGCWLHGLQGATLPSRGPGLLREAFDRTGGNAGLMQAELARFAARRSDAAGPQPAWKDWAGAVLASSLPDRVGAQDSADRLAEEWRLARWLNEHGVLSADLGYSAQEVAPCLTP